MALIRAVLLLLFGMFLAFIKGRFIASFRYVFGPEKGRLVYSRLSVCVCWSLTSQATRVQLYMRRHRCAGGVKKIEDFVCR